MKRKLLAVTTALVLGATSSLGHAAMVDFEDIGLAAGNTGFAGSFVSGGFDFTSPSNHIHSNNQSASRFSDSGSANLMIHDNGGNNANNALTMAQIGRGVFSINSVSLAEGFVGFGAATVHVVGNLFGGGSVIADFTLDGVNDGGPGGVADFETFNFSAAWSNLLNVTFSGIGGTPNEHAFSVDNITVNQGGNVPEPAALGLMGLALAGLAFSRRKKA